MKTIFHLKPNKVITIQIKDGSHIWAQKDLTISRDFDNLLITALDNITQGTKIDRLCLKTAQILGKMNSGSLSVMILRTIKQAIEVVNLS